MDRRWFVMGGAMALGGCATTKSPQLVSLMPLPHRPHLLPSTAAVEPGVRDLREVSLKTDGIPALGAFDSSAYAGLPDDVHPIPPLDLKRVDKAFLRSVVLYPSLEKAGTIFISPKTRYLHLVLGDGRAIRYGVGVGREGFAWSGTADVRIKRTWPKWFPPPEMIARDSRLRQYAKEKFMPGGLGNPLGARAHYLWQDSHDTYFRVHGTNEPESIGKAVSSGCIRMHNLDVVDLYSRVALGTKVIVEG